MMQKHLMTSADSIGDYFDKSRLEEFLKIAFFPESIGLGLYFEIDGKRNQNSEKDYHRYYLHRNGRSEKG